MGHFDLSDQRCRWLTNNLKMTISTVVFAAVILGLSVTSSTGYKVVCYYTNWAQYRPAPYAFTPEDIDPSLCTHINYAFAKVVGTTIQGYETNDDGQNGMYARMMKLKATKPSLKVMLSVGGWTHGTAPFSAVVRSESSMHTFAQNVVKYLRQRNFDGFDIDWEYPGSRGSPAGDKQKYTRFLQILKDAFTAEAAQSGKPRLLLSAAVAAGKSAVMAGYEISKVAAILDHINLMSYDLHGSWESTAGENSPLYAAHNDYGDDASMNQDWAVKYWIQHGCPPEKLIMGLGTYGRSLHLSQPSQHGVHDRINGAGTMGAITKEAGFLAYYEICEKLKHGYTRVWNDEQKVPYAYSSTDWVGYDDVQSFQVKADYIKANHLGGGMVWTIDLDDFANKCGKGKYPLMNVLKNKLLGNNQNVAPVTQQQTTPTTRNSHTTWHQTTWHPKTTLHQTTWHPKTWTTWHQKVWTTWHPKTTWHQTTWHPKTTWHPVTHHPTPRPTTAAPQQQHHQTAAPNVAPGNKCRPQIPSSCDHDIYPDLCDCRYYYVCDDRGFGKIVFRDHKCPDKTVFDVQKQYCNWISEVGLDSCRANKALFGK